MKRVLLGLLLTLLLLILSVAGVATWLLSTPSGLRFAVARAQAYLPALQVSGLDGPAGGPISVYSIVYRDASVEVEVRGLRLEWSPRALLAHRIDIDLLQAQSVELRLLDSGAPPTPPSQGPVISELPWPVSLAQLAIDRLKIQPSGTAPIELLQTRLAAARWEGPQVLVQGLSTESAWVGGALRLDARARLAGDHLDITDLTLEGPFSAQAQGRVSYVGDSDLHLSWKQLRYPFGGEPVVSSAEGEARLQGGPDAAAFSLEAALGREGRVQAKGRWDGQLDAELRWQALQYPLVADQPLVQSAEGEARVSGSPQDYAVQLDAALQTRELPGRLRGRARGSDRGLTLDALDVEALGGALAANGTLAWAPQLAADLKGSFQNIDPERLLAGWPGRLTGEFSLKGTLPDPVNPQPDARFALKLHDARLRGYRLALDAAGRYAQAALGFERLELRSGGSLATLSGQVTEPMDARIHVDSPDLAQLWPGAEGQVRLDAQVQGRYAEPVASVDAELERIHYQAYRIEQASAELRLDLDRRSSLTIQARGADLGRRIDTLRLEGGGLVGDHSLHLTAEAAGTRAEMSVSGRYDRATPAWTGQLASLRLALPTIPAWALQDPAALAWTPARASLSQACFAAQSSSFCVDASSQQQRGLRDTQASFTLNRFDLKEYEGLFPATMHVETVVSGQGSLRLSNADVRSLQAQLHAEPGHVRAASAPTFSFLAAQLSLNQEADRLVGRLDFPLEKGGLQAEATVPSAGADWAQRPLTGSVRLNLPDLTWLPALTPMLRNVEGRAEALGNLAGTLGAPRWHGDVVLANGAAELTALGVRVTDVQARISGAEGQALEISASAHSGKGSIGLDGQYAGPGDLDLRIQGENFLAAQLPMARVIVAPDLRLRLQGEQARLDGRVQVPEADIRLTRFDSGVSPSTDQVIVGDEAPQGEGQRLAVRSEVAVVLGPKVRLEGYGLKTRLEGQVTALDEPGRDTAGRGEIRLVEGQYKAYGQDLSIQTGRLLFNGGPISQPALELKALRTVKEEDVEVGVQVRGTLNRPQFTLFSKPSMSQREQLSYLLLGRSLDETGNSSQGDMLAGAALSLGLSGGEKLANSLGGNFGLNNLELGSESSTDSTTGQQRQIITVGKYLSPKLYVAYGRDLLDQGNVFRLLYDLGRGFKLSTESGVNAGGDLLYTFERP